MKFRAFPCLLFSLAPCYLMGAGYYLPNQDAFATARGNAFVATADSAAAVFYNPAGMTQLEKAEAEAGVYAIVLGNEANVAGESTDAKNELQAAPQIFYVQPYNDKLTFGFGLNSPFGLGTEWGRDNNFSSVVTEARLMYVSATSAVAYKINDQLSVGASFSINYADLTLEQGLGVPGSYLRFNGDDIGFSGTVSTRWQPCEQHSFGLIYSTESSFDLDGKTTSNGLADDKSASLDFMAPARVAGGYSYRPAPGWNIEADVEWLNWDSLNTLNLKSSSVGGSAPIKFDWQSSFIYELGGSYTTPDGYIFAAGYDFNANSQPDENFSAGVSDANRHWFNLGFGRKMGWASWMLAYQFGYSNRTVDGATNPLSNGKYESRHNALLFSWQQKF
ncbi:MAG: outer membrane protein transport protein [Luteolibacter sp.]